MLLALTEKFTPFLPPPPHRLVLAVRRSVARNDYTRDVCDVASFRDNFDIFCRVLAVGIQTVVVSRLC